MTNGVLDNSRMKELVASWCPVRLIIGLLQKVAKTVTLSFSVGRGKL